MPYTALHNPPLFIALLIKLAYILIIIFACYPLFLEFFFCYLSQSSNGPHLTIVNFVAPAIATLLILFAAIVKILFGNWLVKTKPIPAIVNTILTLLLGSLLVWQIHYLVGFVSISMNADNSRDFWGTVTEFLPISTGIIVTFYFLGVVVKGLFKK